MSGIFDSFSLPSVDSLVGGANNAIGSVLSGVKNAANSGISAFNASSSRFGTPAVASKANGSAGYYKVYIVAKLPSGGDMYLVADGPESYNYSTSLSYETPYQDVGEKILDKAASLFGPAGDAAKALIHGSGTRMFTQALTAKVWSGAGETTISLPLIFQADTDAETDVLTPLMQLMFLSMPREAKEGGFLSGPGPVFDWATTVPAETHNGAAYGTKTSSPVLDVFAGSLDAIAGSLLDSTKNLVRGEAGASLSNIQNGAQSVLGGLSNTLKKLVNYPISLQIGKGFRLDEVVIESVSQTHRLSPVGGAYNQSSGINSRVLVEVTFKTFYTLTQRDIAKMLLPMNIAGSKTMEAYKKHLGNG